MKVTVTVAVTGDTPIHKHDARAQVAEVEAAPLTPLHLPEACQLWSQCWGHIQHQHIRQPPLGEGRGPVWRGLDC
jgi:hypothetical protein